MIPRNTSNAPGYVTAVTEVVAALHRGIGRAIGALVGP